MAGNIPPLVSSTPPPLNAFDDDDEEEEDEFGLYNTAEEIDYNECISYREKEDEKQNTSKSRGEQDSTSQDSATDSGLCPDSEGMSPTPHSDDERTLKPNSCDERLQGVACELGASQAITSVNTEAAPIPGLPNGHGEEGCGQEADDDFGSFEFSSSRRIQSVEENVSRSKLPFLDSGQNNEELNRDNILNIQSFNEQTSEKIEESENNFTEFNSFESNSNVEHFENSNFTVKEEDIFKNKESITQCDESKVENADVGSSNDSSSFNSVDISLEPKEVVVTECGKTDQCDMTFTEKPQNNHEDASKSTTDNLDYREEIETEISFENSDDDEFDDFTDFKANFSSNFDSTKSDQGDNFNEHSKTLEEETKLEEAASSLPPSHQEESDDEFSNFADFSSSDCAFVSAQSSNSLDNVPHIPLKVDDNELRTESEFQDWVSVFPSEDVETPPVVSALLTQDDVVWSRLFPLESSPALSYQWNESLSNRRLLTALNIDSRNILFTPWSSSAVPRFAANLSCGPLEPIKATEPLQPPAPAVAIPAGPPPATHAPTPATTSATQESVPDAHFDWVSSGLTNPLDCPKTVLNLPKTLSAGAEKILNSLPDISFMRKTYIDFPINEA